MPGVGARIGAGRRQRRGGDWPSITGEWLLVGGVWADAGQWDDNAVWFD